MWTGSYVSPSKKFYKKRKFGRDRVRSHFWWLGTISWYDSTWWSLYSCWLSTFLKLCIFCIFVEKESPSHRTVCRHCKWGFRPLLRFWKKTSYFFTFGSFLLYCNDMDYCYTIAIIWSHNIIIIGKKQVLKSGDMYAGSLNIWRPCYPALANILEAVFRIRRFLMFFLASRIRIRIRKSQVHTRIFPYLIKVLSGLK